MAYDPRPDLCQSYNPWQRFTQRDVAKHNAEDGVCFCPPHTPISAAEVINRFLGHGFNTLDEAVPRKRQLLRDFLEEAITIPRNAPRIVEQDISATSRSIDVALLDDRQNHERCAKRVSQVCNDCNIFSKNLSILELYKRLQEDVSSIHIFKFSSAVTDVDYTMTALKKQSRETYNVGPHVYLIRV